MYSVDVVNKKTSLHNWTLMWNSKGAGDVMCTIDICLVTHTRCIIKYMMRNPQHWIHFFLQNISNLYELRMIILNRTYNTIWVKIRNALNRAGDGTCHNLPKGYFENIIKGTELCRIWPIIQLDSVYVWESSLLL